MKRKYKIIWGNHVGFLMPGDAIAYDKSIDGEGEKHTSCIMLWEAWKDARDWRDQFDNGPWPVAIGLYKDGWKVLYV